MKFNEMKALCLQVVYQERISQHAKIGDTSCVIVSDSGKCYTGISFVASANVGFCAEQAAIADMIKNHETKINQLLTVDKFGNIFPPCGKCLELITALNEQNRQCMVYLDDQRSVSVAELYPFDWKKIKDDFKKAQSEATNAGEV